ncbi:hypothetical protein EOI86_06760 [Hwanghaeella grinnelliae]|uniref:Hemerythrin-like domain-containing protein n=1 Tax=Hwanghaeella grinnelliae TaxID=2500179 RepID=A0A3S2VQ22_9PROT|nr:hypothetical protein [Hwanghaeella grinnelliae]RVU38959.1 hypothetical protein EOI86_06760 [Hwanghaeella grinnelliae]
MQEIDDDHQSVVDALEEVRIHLENSEYSHVKKTREITQTLLSHFRHEEDLMRHVDYPHTEAHCIHHDQTLGHIYRIVGNAELQETVTLGDLRDLYRTLLDDIFSADMNFHKYLLETNRLRN